MAIVGKLFKLFALLILCNLCFINQIKAEDYKERMSMEECIEEALEVSTLVKAQQWVEMGSKFEKRASFVSILPTFKAEYSHTFLDEQPMFSTPGAPSANIPVMVPDPLSPIGMSPTNTSVGEFVHFPARPDSTVPAGDDEIKTFQISVEQPIFMGGALYYGYKMSKLNLEIAREELRRVRMDLIYTIKESYLNLVKAREYVKLAEQAKEVIAQFVERTRNFHEVGIVPKSDVLSAEVELAQAEERLAQAKNGDELARATMNVLLSRPLDQPLEAISKVEYVPFEKSEAECLETALVERPDLRSADLGIKVANRYGGVARASLFPKVMVIGAYVHEEGSFNTDEDRLSLTIGAQWVFWNWGKDYFMFRAARMVEKKAKEGKSTIKAMVILDVRSAYLQIKQAKNSIETTKKVVVKAEENLRVMDDRYQANLVTATDVLNAQTTLLQAKTDALTALINHNLATSKLYKAMGRAP